MSSFLKAYRATEILATITNVEKGVIVHGSVEFCSKVYWESLTVNVPGGNVGSLDGVMFGLEFIPEDERFYIKANNIKIYLDDIGED